MTDNKKQNVVEPTNVPIATPSPAPQTIAPPEPVFVPLPGPMPELPELYVTRRALAEMNNEVLAHPKTETAWGLYGFQYPNCIFVVGVLRPVAGEVVRGYANAEAGGIEMANAMRWLYANEKLINIHVGKKSGKGEFVFLYKGHSHHALNYNQYSSTDHRSIYEAVKDDGLTVAIGPLALIRSNGVSFSASLFGDEATVSEYSRVSFVFYMMTKEMVGAGYTEAVRVKPKIIDTVNTLLVPPLGWEFVRDDDFKEQIRHLKSFGYQVKVNYVDVNGVPPLEIQFVVDDSSFKATLYITTDWNYPEVAPQIILLPKTGSGLSFSEAKLFAAMTWWKKGEDFIDIVGRMRKAGCL